MRKLFVVATMVVVVLLAGCGRKEQPKKTYNEDTTYKPYIELNVTNERIATDDLFKRDEFRANVTIINHTKNSFEPRFKFEMYSPQGSTVSSTYNGDCSTKFFSTTIKSLGQMTCSIAFEIEMNGDYQLEIYRDYFADNPTHIYQYSVIQGKIYRKS